MMKIEFPNYVFDFYKDWTYIDVSTRQIPNKCSRLHYYNVYVYYIADKYTCVYIYIFVSPTCVYTGGGALGVYLTP